MTLEQWAYVLSRPDVHVTGQPSRDRVAITYADHPDVPTVLTYATIDRARTY